MLSPAAFRPLLFAIAAAALPGCGEPDTIDINRYTLTFADEFDSLNVSPWGPGTRWIAHTPWAGDFGDAQFADPEGGFPFMIKDGVLTITARRNDDGKWRSGLLSSFDPTGAGFSQQYGYFEIRAKFPEGPGVWPAFWLVSSAGGSERAEIDVVEYYGHADDEFRSNIHIWTKTPAPHFGEGHVTKVEPGALTAAFNTYGVSIDADTMIFYLNRREVWRQPMREEFRQPMGVLLNLALGSGWPIDKTPNPSVMEVDYVRAYAFTGP